ncbi:CoA-binding protein [Pseudoroseomonas rhizosphaerae]|uniref:CoA-binding protein n=1 Tax=Teichococcus rhizosphaerae TaxID=1335062 RepID=A0A2C7AB82_9PROT|nr:CoA-binding protein [Pseudoroseomonas rhizosphaerae]
MGGEVQDDDSLAGRAAARRRGPRIAARHAGRFAPVGAAPVTLGSWPAAATVAPFFNARSVAVIGASADPLKIGGRPVAGLIEAGFEGRILPVNPNYPTVQGLPAYRSIADVPGEVDLAIVSVPTRDVHGAIEACAAKGVRAAVVFSAGFAEVDEAGRQAQDSLVALARRHGMRLMGPNCMGTINVRRRLIASFTYIVSGNWPKPGGVSIVSQSGAFGSYCLGLARDQGIGLNLWATTGNQADVDFTDTLAYALEDPETRVVLAYIEGCGRPQALVGALERARALGKPVVMMKVGASDVGAAAAASHTASLAGADEVYDALFRQYDVHRARSLEEFLSIGYACNLGRFPTTPALGVLTISGGAGVLTADTARREGLDVPELPAPAREELRALVPAGGLRNPVDLTGAALHDFSLWPKSLRILMQQGGCPTAVLFMAHLGRNPVFVERLRPIFEALSAEFSDRVFALAMDAAPEVRRSLEERGMLVYRDPVEATRAIAALVRFGRAFAERGAAEAPPVLPPQPDLPAGPLDERAAKAILAGAGIPMVPDRIARTAEEAAAAAEALGFPVAMKILSPDIAHKTEVGGVALGLASAAAVRDAFARIGASAREKAPGARIEGVIVSPMVGRGTEMILGVHRDPVFGPVVMAGLGGIHVEALGDVSFRVAPFSEAEAMRMLRELRAWPLLEGARGAPPADVEALAAALARLSVFADRHRDRLLGVDVNPFILHPRGRGGVAVDALIQTL